ncbi:MAG: MAPEG family protein [Bradyrhizobium sp.]|nr:MAPEG family protein [Bradyrhizobium sp.]MDE2330723.1 MAPEG family protein [Bradyrhizobium sp.]
MTMHLPAITATYLAALALLYAALGLQVVRLRRRNRAGFGDGGDTELRSAIRAHAHFAEYVPIIVLMVALLEASGLPALRVHLLMAALLLARVLHPVGMHASPGSLQFNLGRIGGMVITIIVMVSSALLILSRLSLTLF